MGIITHRSSGTGTGIISFEIIHFSNRLSETYKMPVASFAVLADDNPKWRPSEYREEI